ncbi:MAG: hypothetical protein QOJ52_1499 [Acidimicrobiaceae bacterium]|nr:hypothetical protein [Acidimicrobiaceae bacterium]
MRMFRRLGRMSSAIAVAVATATLGLAGVATAAGPASARAAAPAAAGGHTATVAPNGCQLGNGVSHVIEITFDNVHFFRDNPNVPSDLELMPHLLNFIEQNGTMLSNNHTPLIAHTANDSLTNYTGLYGDRHGMPISNTFQSYNADGTTDKGVSFAYWTDPIFDATSPPNPGHDTNPSMVYSPVPPGFAKPAVAPNTITPAPWVPFTRAGCDVGNVSTANMVLENTGVDIPKVFGPNSPETAQLAADSDPFKDPEVADYLGIGVHCAQGNSFCGSASAVKFGQSAPSPTAAPDVLPTEPGAYNGFQALFGHRYVAPQLGAGTPNVTRNGFPVTNAAGNLVDLAGKQINGAFLTNYPGFPGFGPINAAQSLAYAADMQESGVPVVQAYIADIHGNNDKTIPACAHSPAALGSGDPCYIAQAQAYDAAFATFFQRLAADGINASNTEFVVTADEGDHEAGANVGRAIQPTPANCDGAVVTGTTVTPDVACTYPAGTFGELNTNVKGLLVTQKNNTTPFSLEADSAPQFYVTGQPARTNPAVRQLERDAAGLTASNPYSGNPNETIANYLADPVEEAILHIVNADPARTPTFTMFAKPDYFLFNGAPNCTAACVSINTGFAYNHGDYAAEIDTTWLGLAGPGVANKGVDGLGPTGGPSSAGPDSGNVTVPGSGTTGTWVDHTDIRPTLLHLVGLKDDYIQDGRIITEDLTSVPATLSLPAVQSLGQVYKQLNASVGLFGTATLVAATHALASSSAADSHYTVIEQQLLVLGQRRDALATTIKNKLNAAEFSGTPISFGSALSLTLQAQSIIAQAERLATSS